MTDKAILKDLGGVLADASAITKLVTDAIRKQHEVDDTEDEDLEAAGNALLAIYGTLEETIGGLEERSG